MRKISKEERKAYNEYAEQKQNERAEKAGAFSVLIVLFTILAFASGHYLPEPFGGYAFIGFAILASLMVAGKAFNSREEKPDLYK